MNKDGGTEKEPLQGESAANSDDNSGWYYELKGKRLGPVTSDRIIKLITNRVIKNETLVWSKGLANWTPLSESVFYRILDTPPPLTGSAVNNTIVWLLAFVPIIALILENIIAGTKDLNINNLWFIPLAFNIVLSLIDESQLRKAGHDTGSMGIAWLVPIYLFKRAKILKQKNYYAFVWCITFGLAFLFPSAILNNPILNLGYGNTQLVNSVKNGHLQIKPNITVGTAIDSYFENPKWTSIVGTEGNNYVNISGNILFNGKKEAANLQFKVDKNSFVFNALEINGVPQNFFIYLSLIEAMYNAP